MSQCPVCQAEYIEEIERCYVCDWDLTPYPLTFTGQIPEGFLNKEKAKLAWARKIWAKSQSQLQQLDQEKAQFQKYLAQILAKLDHLNQAPSQEVSDALSQTQAQLGKLQSQLSQVQGQLQQIQEGGTQLLDQAQQERSQIQSQLSDLSSQVSNLEGKLILKSAVGVDYKRLSDLLAAKNWQEADRETRNIILRVCLNQQEDEIKAADINNFPCQDLRIIDQLWVKFSNGHFGFSVQKRIWHSVDADIFDYCGRVGWSRRAILRDEIWLKDILFSLSAPKGHLPFTRLEFKKECRLRDIKDLIEAFCSRLDACQLRIF